MKLFCLSLITCFVFSACRSRSESSLEASDSQELARGLKNYKFYLKDGKIAALTMAPGVTNARVLKEWPACFSWQTAEVPKNDPFGVVPKLREDLGTRDDCRFERRNVETNCYAVQCASDDPEWCIVRPLVSQEAQQEGYKLVSVPQSCFDN